MYSDLFADPIDMVRRVYARFDLEYTPEFERRMLRYLDDNKQGKYGRHTYSLEEYGFDAASLFRKFEPYMSRYDFEIPTTMQRPTQLGDGASLG
jgi:hypothetical protein